MIRAARNDELELVGTGQWDDDPNVRFNRSDATRWLKRFDDDGDWPNKAARVVAPSLVHAASPSMPVGSTCPRSGWWFTPSIVGSRRFLQAGDTFPDAPEKSWDSDQSDPSL